MNLPTTVEELEKRKSRWALSSGASDRVYDGAIGDNSPFAAAILNVLKYNEEDYLNVAKLVDKVLTLTRDTSAQLPEGNPIFGVGHEGGQFIFRRRESAQKSKPINEIEAWQKATEFDSTLGYEEYIKSFPRSKNVGIAQKRIADFEDEKSWEEAFEENSIEAFKKYLSFYNKGKYEDEARGRIQALEKEEELRERLKEMKALGVEARRHLESKQYNRSEELFLIIYRNQPDVLEDYLPPTVLENGYDGIKKFFEQLRQGENVRVFETRIILVGEGAVGKTSLTRKLIDPSTDLDLVEETTRGIDIRIWTFSDGRQQQVKARVWDFGGQEIYRSTHQFFLSKRAYYILVWEARREERFDYWLKMIHYLADASPTILVQNKIDDRIKRIDEEAYRRNYQNIGGFFNISCLTNEGIDHLTRFVRDAVLRLPHLDLTVPRSWIEIKKRLEEDTRNSIEYDEFREICYQNHLKDRGDQLLEYLHDLGVVLHFKKHHALRHIIILNPDWITKAVYMVLDHKRVVENGGYFNYADLASIWGEEGTEYYYPASKYPALIELMKKFEMCFQSTVGDGLIPPEFIIPELLSPSEPNLVNVIESEINKQVRFEFSYPSILPPGLLPRFICRVNSKVDKEYLWRKGVLLRYENSIALVRSFIEESKVKIIVTGNYKRDLLEIIRAHFNELHRTLNLIGVEAKLPCNCSECVTLDRPNLYDYRRLKERLLDTGKTELECTLSYENISVLKLFGDLVEVVQEKGVVNYIFHGDITGNNHQFGDNNKML